MSGATPVFPLYEFDMHLWGGQGKLYFVPFSPLREDCNVYSRGRL